MGELVGLVTRSLGAPNQAMTSVSAGGSDALSRNQFVASRLNGDLIGSFAGVREAQRAIENATTGSVGLVWRQIASADAIERWEGRSTYWYPGDLGTLLSDGGAWWRADQGLRRRPTSAAGTSFTIPTWASFDGSRTIRATAPSVATQPLLVDSALGGRPALRFAADTIDRMTTNLTLGASDSDFSVYALATYAAAGREQVIVQNGAGFGMGVTAGGNWFVDTSSSRILGPAAAAGEPAVLGARVQTVTGVTTLYAYFNFALLGSDTTSNASTAWEISDAVNGWSQDIEEILVGLSAFSTNVQGKVREYFNRRYLQNF